MIIDSHCHASPIWYEPVESLLFQMDRHGVARAVLVQQMGQFDNTYFLQCAERHPDRFWVVGLVDAAQPDAGAALTRLAEQGAAGVRLHAETRSPGDDPYAVWRQAAALGLRISCIGTSAAFAHPDFALAVEAAAGTPVIVEHLGDMARIGGAVAPQADRAAILALARYPHVAMKFHGLGEICARPLPFQPFPFDRTNLAILDAALQAFGAARLMWGSDFPPVSGREGYANALAWPRDHLQQRPTADIEALFGGTAARLFGRTSGTP